MKTTRRALEQFCNERLCVDKYQDYGPNGLQIEGKETIERVAFAVSATLDSIRAAVAKGADALVVHHGLLWNFHGVRPLVGPFGQRVQWLMKHEVSLLGYHLPLDGHVELGNAACLAQALGLQNIESFGEYQGMPTGVQGGLPVSMLPSQLQAVLEKVLQHQVLLSTPDPRHPVRTLGIITGGANGGWREAAAAGLDAYVTGEMSEHDWHDAQEAGIHMFAGGHHATEVFGIQRLMQEVQGHFAIDCFFLNASNPA